MCLRDKMKLMKAGEVLFIMKRRLSMQEDGTTNPSDDIKRYTKNLVHRLSVLDKEEEVDLEIEESGKVKTILVSTGEVLAEHDS